MLGQDDASIYGLLYFWEAIGTYELPTKQLSFSLNPYEHPWQLLEARFEGDVNICSQLKMMFNLMMLIQQYIVICFYMDDNINIMEVEHID